MHGNSPTSSVPDDRSPLTSRLAAVATRQTHLAGAARALAALADPECTLTTTDRADLSMLFGVLADDYQAVADEIDALSQSELAEACGRERLLHEMLGLTDVEKGNVPPAKVKDRVSALAARLTTHPDEWTPEMLLGREDDDDSDGRAGSRSTDKEVR